MWEDENTVSAVKDIQKTSVSEEIAETNQVMTDKTRCTRKQNSTEGSSNNKSQEKNNSIHIQFI